MLHACKHGAYVVTCVRTYVRTGTAPVDREQWTYACAGQARALASPAQGSDQSKVRVYVYVYVRTHVGVMYQ